MLQKLKALFRVNMVEIIEPDVRCETAPSKPIKTARRPARRICEIFIHDEWQVVTVEAAIKARDAYAKLKVRCSTCHNRAVLHRAHGTGIPAHFEHARGAGPCIVTRGAVPQDNA